MLTREHAYVGMIVVAPQGHAAEGRRGVIVAIPDEGTTVTVRWPVRAPRMRSEIIRAVLKSPATVQAVYDEHWPKVWKYLKVTEEERIAQAEGIEAEISEAVLNHLTK